MKKLIICLLVAVTLTGCSKGVPKAQTALEENGYSEIVLGGNVWMSCGKDDWIFSSYHFTANNGNKDVKGYVCCGFLFKGCTIRF